MEGTACRIQHCPTGVKRSQVRRHDHISPVRDQDIPYVIWNLLIDPVYQPLILSSNARAVSVTAPQGCFICEEGVCLDRGQQNGLRLELHPWQHALVSLGDDVGDLLSIPYHTFHTLACQPDVRILFDTLV